MHLIIQGLPFSFKLLGQFFNIIFRRRFFLDMIKDILTQPIFFWYLLERFKGRSFLRLFYVNVAD